MKRIENDSFILGKSTKIIKKTSEITIHELQEPYGSGTITFYYMMPEIYVYVSDFSLSNNYILNSQKDYEFYSKKIFKMDYCFKGKICATDIDGKSCIARAGQTSYYYGEKNLQCLEMLENNYKGIGIIGFADDIVEIFSNIFHIEEELFIKLGKQTNKHKNYISIKSNLEVTALAHKLMDAINQENLEMMKIKAMEWLIYEIKHIEENLLKKENVYTQNTIKKILEAEKYIKNNLSEKLTIDSISNTIGLSQSTLKKGFNTLYSTSIYSYIKSLRLDLGRSLIISTDKSITEIALECGYDNLNSFSKAFKQYYNITPRELRK